MYLLPLSRLYPGYVDAGYVQTSIAPDNLNHANGGGPCLDQAWL